MSKSVFPNLGFLLQIAGLLCLLPIAAGYVFGETEALASMFLSAIAFFSFGFLLNALCERRNLSSRSAIALVLLTFIIMPLIGALPYFYSDPFQSSDAWNRFTNSYFESVSGFTTTGFSFIAEPSTLAKSFLLYRSMTELMGGVGFVFILFAFLQSKSSLETISETLGIENNGVDLRKIYLSIFGIYCTYIILFTLVLYALGYRDVVSNGSLVIDILTGGFQPSTALIPIYLNPIVLSLFIVLMLLGSLNFNFSYQLFTRKFKGLISEEIIVYSIVILSGTVLAILLTGKGLFDSLFHVISMSSSTGFDYINFSSLNETAVSIFLVLMILGGCGFSMAGGLRMFRVIQLIKTIRKFALTNGTESKATDADKATLKEIEQSLLTIVLFIFTLFFFSVLFSTIGISLTDSIFEVGSAMTTNGASLGVTTVNMPWFYKWILISAMIIGRVEILPLFTLLAYPIITNYDLLISKLNDTFNLKKTK